MTRAPRRRPSEEELIRVRIRAALTNQPRLSPRELANVTGCSLSQAIIAIDDARGR
jgi:hypothetical protein